MECNESRSAAESLLRAEGAAAERVAEVLQRFGVGPLRAVADAGVRVVLLERHERYRDRSAALERLGIDVDAWPAPPAGLFVVEERAVYLRSYTPMTIAHEFGHALDCALGGGVYHTSFSPRVRTLFSQANAFVTPYAATAVDEYFAESVRAFVGVNDRQSLWPPVSSARLRRVDRNMHAYLQETFELLEGRYRSEAAV